MRWRRSSDATTTGGDRHRDPVGNVHYAGPNFGLMDVDWESAVGPVVLLSICDHTMDPEIVNTEPKRGLDP